MTQTKSEPVAEPKPGEAPTDPPLPPPGKAEPKPTPAEADADAAEAAPAPTCTGPADAEKLAKVRKYWEHQDPSVSQFEKVLADLPDDEEMRSAMARVLLPTEDLLEEDDEGNSGWCKGVFEGALDEEPMEMQTVEPTEILSASGCARRALFLHMVEFLTACDIEASETSVKLLLSSTLHEPDHVAALALISQAERVGKAEWVLSHAFDEAPPSLQRLAVERLAELGTDAAKDTLKKAATEGLCSIAYQAAEAAADLGVPDVMPEPDKAETAAEAFFELCMLASQEEHAADASPLWQPLIDEKGYQMTVDCRDWDDEDVELNGHCDPLSHRKRNPPEHAWGPRASCTESKGAVRCKSNPVNENTGVASRVDPTWFTFAKRSDRWVLDKVVVTPKVTDRWNY